jgi:hypothetical protein
MDTDKCSHLWDPVQQAAVAVLSHGIRQWSHHMAGKLEWLVVHALRRVSLNILRMAGWWAGVLLATCKVHVHVAPGAQG